MTTRLISRHIRRHWPHHLAFWGLLAALITVTGAAAAIHHVHGGFKPGPVPPPVRIMGGPLPAAWSLDQFVVRIHNQGNSNSCVAQSIAAMEEITWNEAHSGEADRASLPSGGRIPMSSGFIYNQLDRGRNQGLYYADAFGLVMATGDATLENFPPDGAADIYSEPSPAVIAGAWPHHIRSFASIQPWDRYTIEAEIHAGRPAAIAIPVTDAYYNNWNDSSLPVISGQSGNFWFWHSMAIVGYTPQGVEILNSWGPSWGDNGRAILTWDFIASVNPEIVISTPLHPPWHFRSEARYRFPWPVWNAWADGHHWPGRRYISPLYRGRWSWAASVWSRNLRYRRLRGVRTDGRWYGPTSGGERSSVRSHGFTRTDFAHGSVYTWPDFHTAMVTYLRGPRRRVVRR
ncbi:MAG: C1 family peptidase [Chloroflexota bacterium]